MGKPIGATLLYSVAVTMTYQGKVVGRQAGRRMCPVPSAGLWWGDTRAAGCVGYAETLKERTNTERLIQDYLENYSEVMNTEHLFLKLSEEHKGNIGVNI